MTEPNTAAPTTTDPATTSPAADPATEAKEYVPPATQADLDRIIADRVSRTKAQFKDHAELRAKAAELDQIKQQNQTTEQRQAEELSRWQTEAQQWRSTAVGARIEALASSAFADPSDAVGQLDVSKYLDVGGQIDEAAIRADLEDLLARKPHWRRPEAGTTAPRAPAPNPAQGTSGTTGATQPQDQFAALIRGALKGP